MFLHDYYLILPDIYLYDRKQGHHILSDGFTLKPGLFLLHAIALIIRHLSLFVLLSSHFDLSVCHVPVPYVLCIHHIPNSYVILALSTVLVKYLSVML